MTIVRAEDDELYRNGGGRCGLSRRNGSSAGIVTSGKAIADPYGFGGRWIASSLRAISAARPHVRYRGLVLARSFHGRLIEAAKRRHRADERYAFR
jgi:hypothetical protein